MRYLSLTCLIILSGLFSLPLVGNAADAPPSKEDLIKALTPAKKTKSTAASGSEKVHFRGIQVIESESAASLQEEKIEPPTVVYIACDVSMVELTANTLLPSNSTSLPKSVVVGVVPLSTLSAELKRVSAPPGRTVRLEITYKGALIPALLRSSVLVFEIVGEPMVRFAMVMVFVKLDEVVASMVTVIGVVGARLVM